MMEKEILEIDEDKMLTILKVLSTIEPAPMSFSFFFPDRPLLEKDINSGITAWLLKQTYIRVSGTDNYSFAITEPGLKHLYSERSPSGRPIEKFSIGEEDVMVSLQAHDWAHKNEALWTPLVQDLMKSNADLPLVTFGTDLPDRFEPFPLTETNEELIPTFMEMAKSNIEKIKVEIAEVDNWLLVVHGNYFAAEKILDAKFMLTLHQRLKADTLVASVPRKGFLFVAENFKSLQDAEKFTFFTKSKYLEQEKSKALSTSIFVIMEGVIRGTVKGT